MTIDNGSDFDAAFAEATAEVEAGGGSSAEGLKQNAKIHLGDDEVIDPQADEVEGDSEGEETDEPVDESEDDEDEGADNSEVFDVASHADELVTVKVDGEEMSVPLGEVVKGYMRQADYTRKTQQVAELKAAAEWGKQMRDALLEDPQGVILALAESFGVEFQTDEGGGSDPYDTDDPEMAPILGELKATKAQLAALERRQAENDQAAVEFQVRRELDDVASKYDDFDPHTVLPVAIKLKVSIEDAYFVVKAQEAKEARKTAVKAKDVAATSAKKRQVTDKVTTGSKRNASQVKPEGESEEFADMLEFALANK